MATNCRACAACVPEMPRLYTLAEAERLLYRKKAVGLQKRKKIWSTSSNRRCAGLSCYQSVYLVLYS